MKNILLVCGAGMSTSLLVKKMQEADCHHEYNIKCCDTVTAEVVLKDYDIFLLAPHISYMKDDFLVKCEQYQVPFMVIDTLDYTQMNGMSVLQKVQGQLQDKQHLFKVVLLHAGGGVMTDLILLDMKKKLRDEEKDWLIESCKIEEFQDDGDVDLILLESQLSYEMNNLKQRVDPKTKIMIPPRDLYASFDGRKVLDYIQKKRKGE